MSDLIVTAVLNGYSASSRPTRTSEIVKSLLDEYAPGSPFIGLKSMVTWPRARRVSRFIDEHSKPYLPLLLVGKSLGATHMIKRIINPRLEPFRAREVVLVTIDPCWPALGDWTPNLNGKVLTIQRKLSSATNLYVVAKERRQQAGALIASSGWAVRNIPIVDADHFSVVDHPLVKETLRETIRSLI